MSTSKFMRLFREIEKSMPDEIPTDFSYQKEREEIIQSLVKPQFKDKNNLLLLKNIGFTEPINPSKHHGKGARIVQELNQTKKIINNASNNQAEVMALKKSMAIKLAETKINSNSYQNLRKQIRVELKLHEESQPIIKEIESCISQNQSIPQHLLIRLSTNQNSLSSTSMNNKIKPKVSTVRPTSSSNSSTLPSLSSFSVSNSHNSHQSLKDNSTSNYNNNKKYSSALPIYQKTLVNNKNYISSLSTFSSASAVLKREESSRKKEINKLNKWVKEEKEKIYSIYHSIPPPDPTWPLGMWRLYLNSFADKFQVYFPSRKHDEIVVKVREMIGKNQMKAIGEEEYWKDIQNKNEK